MKPFTISWSNVPDYMYLPDFFQVARAVSGDENTVHYGYSMNWPVQIKVTFAMDHEPDKYLGMLRIGEEAIHNFTNSMEWKVTILITLDYFGQKIIDNVRNLIAPSLRTLCCKSYAEVFMLFGGLKPIQFTVTDIEFFSLFSRSNTTLNWTFTLDPKNLGSWNQVQWFVGLNKIEIFC